MQLIRQMGLIEGQRILNAQDWESILARGSSAIANWIDEQMKYKTAVIILIGRETASRPWAQHEIQKAWDDKKPLLGIHLHGLSSMGAVDTIGPDPFTQISYYEGDNPGLPIFDPTVTNWDGRIDSQATYRKLAGNIRDWSTQGRIRKN